MSVEAMVDCWGPRFPSQSALVRLVALAIADCVAPDGNDTIEVDEALYEWLSERTGQSHAMVEAAISDLCGLGVLELAAHQPLDATRLRWDFTRRWMAVEVDA